VTRDGRLRGRWHSDRGALECDMSVIVLTLAAALVQTVELSADEKMDPAACPMHEQHMKQQAAARSADPEGHHAQLLARGARAMGFDQERTSHHFRLSQSGGSIEVHVNDPKDRESKQQIASHLRLITRQFSSGDFDIPLATHGEEPAGVADLKRLRGQVHYTFEETALGGRVAIATTDTSALAAVHAFLRYQIQDHQTGDPTHPAQH
jgi:hypothetical protein